MINLTKEGKEILHINKENRLFITSDKIFELKKSEFEEFIKSNFSENNLITAVLQENSEIKDVLIELGFLFEGIEYNPIEDVFEELFSYKIKTELIIKDNELKEILEKLNISY